MIKENSNTVIILLRKKKKQFSNHNSVKKKSNLMKNINSITNEPRFSPINLEKIAKQIELEPALIRIGKNGLSDSIIQEIKNLLPKKKAVKIKILQNAPVEETKPFFEELEKKIGFKLWRVKGNTGIFIFKKINSI